MAQHIQVVAYEVAWPRQFMAEAPAIRRVLAGNAVAIHHIGSTAVPNLAAKPIIDMLIEVRDLPAVDRQTADFQALGYEAMGAFGIPGRRYFRKGGDARTHQLHVFQHDDRAQIERHLAVRDWLRTHPDDAAAYAALKQRLAAQFPEDIEGYCEGKDAFVQALEAKAVAWAQRQLPVLSLVTRPALHTRAAAWFHDKWQVPAAAYLESMQSMGADVPVPQWFVVMDGGRIVAGAGVIDNDFHERLDCAPNLCALYVEPAYRGQGLAGRLLQACCERLLSFGVAPLYLVTEHTAFYERYGWTFAGMARESDGDGWLRLYRAPDF